MESELMDLSQKNANGDLLVSAHRSLPEANSVQHDQLVVGSRMYQIKSVFDSALLELQRGISNLIRQKFMLFLVAYGFGAFTLLLQARVSREITVLIFILDCILPLIYLSFKGIARKNEKRARDVLSQISPYLKKVGVIFLCMLLAYKLGGLEEATPGTFDFIDEQFSSTGRYFAQNTYIFHCEEYSGIDRFIERKKGGILLVYGPSLSMKSFYLRSLSDHSPNILYYQFYEKGQLKFFLQHVTGSSENAKSTLTEYLKRIQNSHKVIILDGIQHLQKEEILGLKLWAKELYDSQRKVIFCSSNEQAPIYFYNSSRTPQTLFIDYMRPQQFRGFVGNNSEWRHISNQKNLVHYMAIALDPQSQLNVLAKLESISYFQNLKQEIKKVEETQGQVVSLIKGMGLPSIVLLLQQQSVSRIEQEYERKSVLKFLYAIGYILENQNKLNMNYAQNEPIIQELAKRGLLFYFQDQQGRPKCRLTDLFSKVMKQIFQTFFNWSPDSNLNELNPKIEQILNMLSNQKKREEEEAGLKIFNLY